MDKEENTAMPCGPAKELRPENCRAPHGRAGSSGGAEGEHSPLMSTTRKPETREPRVRGQSELNWEAPLLIKNNMGLVLMG